VQNYGETITAQNIIFHTAILISHITAFFSAAKCFSFPLINLSKLIQVRAANLAKMAGLIKQLRFIYGL